MALTPPIQPMLAEARRELPPAGALPGQLIMEIKPDGFRAILFARPELVMVQSRQGGDLTGAFLDIATAATELSEPLVLDGELVVPQEGRLHFGELQRRARRRGRSALQAAAERPAHLIVFDVLDAGGTELLAWPYRERRAILEDLFVHFSAGWGTCGELEYHPVRCDLVAEFQADTAVDEGHYRHPVRFLRLREDLTPGDVPPFDN